MKKYHLTNKIVKTLDSIPREVRKKHLQELRVIVVDEEIKIDGTGAYVAGEVDSTYGNMIYIYAPIIRSLDNLKHVLTHELAHIAGMEEDQVRDYMETVDQGDNK